MPGSNGSFTGTRLAMQNFTAAHIMPMIRVYDAAGNVIETHECKGDFKEW
jgi:hypothetical protein